MNDLVALVSGGFDPIHSGHIKMFKQAKILAPYLIVGLNSDAWLTRKKGKPFMPMRERKMIVKHLNMDDDVVEWEDSDHDRVNFAWGVGGHEKSNSSSWILKQWNE